MFEVECVNCGKNPKLQAGDDYDLVFSGEWFVCPYCEVKIVIRMEAVSVDTPVLGERLEAFE